MCNVTCNPERDVICQQGASHRVDVPLSLKPPAAAAKALHHLLVRRFMSKICTFSSYFDFNNFHLFFYFHLAYIRHFKEIILSLLIAFPLVEGIMWMGDGDKQVLSLFLVVGLMLPVCLDPSLRQGDLG